MFFKKKRDIEVNDVETMMTRMIFSVAGLTGVTPEQLQEKMHDHKFQNEFIKELLVAQINGKN